MTDEPKAVGTRWKVIGAVVGALVGLTVTALDDLFELLGLGPEMRFPYQLLGVLAGGYIGAAIGKAIDRKRHRGRPTHNAEGA
jgi:hypothetical protein